MKIAAGIVTYNPNIERLHKNIKHIINQVDELIIYDNNSKNLESIEALIIQYKSIIIIKSQQNVGIASALNNIVEECLKLDVKWVLTLDQDSVCPNNLINTYLSYMNIEKVGMMTLTVKVQDRVIQVNNHSHQDYEFISRCITSASFVSIEVTKLIGGFDDIMFIDYVDHDFCKRMVLEGFKILKVNKLCLDHELGSTKPIKLTVFMNKYFKTKILFHSYSIMRVYYIERNNIYYLRKYKNHLTKEEKKIARNDMWRVARKSILFEKNKIRYCKSIIQGLFDGLIMKVKIYRPSLNESNKQ